MRVLTWIVILGCIAYGVNYLYEYGYFDSFLNSYDNTVSRTSDFVTDRAVKEANFEKDFRP